MDHLDQWPKRKQELLPDGQSYTLALAHDLGLAFPIRAEDAVKQDDRASVIAAGIFVAQGRMMEAMVPDRRENERIPAWRVGSHIGVGKHRDDACDIQSGEHGNGREIE
jgi:hypothetical protein